MVPAFTAVAATTGVTVWGYQTEAATGISGVIADSDDGTQTYDLSGRSVASPKKPGIYIKNGKKFIVR
jgi:arabinan endo-1,5-alpha-L-arabinosidase